ncbi:oxidoreductase alpha (molybdopterin) subunit [Planctopirus limnophila DSM 3776]|uniref:Oxidoreductase alpha (Molybdopterin) subunit n=1 Tax=Planctopirus limnophila (strain ATCC 43296 / DSM 3776 / IFAM 1008 / Mu 290) TaxID=521674 RepID=D5SVD0_PLAL2|nr:FdhF/YdeP family oxidoreductase [Planctopirus limnophila]ADG67200.1 oxidoreductase alpha (molybdopterin) subunit [Planctopirus limnophila DSM 3776]
MRKITTGGGWPAVLYTLRKAREMGGFWKMWQAMRSKNACKTCALGMGGQKGGMVNEAGSFPEVCKKSLQAMASDLQAGIRSEFWQKYSIGQLKSLSPRELEYCGRLVEPVIHEAGKSHYRPISWEDAFARIAERLKSVQPDETFWYFSGRSSNEAGFLLQLFARIYGTNNINNCSFYCHQASGVGLTSVLGTGTATLTLEDVEHADCIFLIGGNPASNHPRLMSTLKHIRRRGGEVIVINPVIETGLVNFSVPSDPWSLLFGTKIASLYVQPQIGGDLALLTGIAKRILELGQHDPAFLTTACDGWSEWKQHLESTHWSEICEKSGVGIDEINAIARRYAKSKNTVFAWTMGITHHAHGVENVEAIANLALMRGMVGRPHAGLMPIRGHSNIQGMGTVGVTPKLKDVIFERLQSTFQISLPQTPGRDTMACMDGSLNRELKFGFCLGGNLFGSNPDAAYAAKALSKLDQIVYLSTTLNTGHAHGLAQETILLPVLARDEEPEPTTQESMFNYMRLSDGGLPRHTGPLSEIHVIAEIAQRVLQRSGPIDWQEMKSAQKIRESLAKVVPGLEALATIGETKQEFQIPGRTFHTPTFPTPSGRAQIKSHELPSLMGAPGEFRLMTIRSEGQFNTVVYEDYDLYRNIDRRDVILMHPEDLQLAGLFDDQRVVVKSAAGEMVGIRTRAFKNIRPGNVMMYYPEANILVPRSLDPRSKTPAFKAIPVTVKAL